MDKRLIAQRFAKAAHTYNEEAKVQAQVAHKAFRLLAQRVKAPCGPLLEVGCGTGIFSRMLLNGLRPARATLNDLCPQMVHSVADLLARPEVEFRTGDAESMELGWGWHVIASCSTLQWFERPERFFRKCREALADGGWMVLTSFGPDNLKELRGLTGRGLPYPDLHTLAAMAGEGMRVVHAEEERVTMRFASPAQVLRHLKETGATALSATPMPPAGVQQLCREYSRAYGQGTEGVPLTYHPVYLIIKKEDN